MLVYSESGLIVSFSVCVTNHYDQQWLPVIVLVNLLFSQLNSNQPHSSVSPRQQHGQSFAEDWPAEFDSDNKTQVIYEKIKVHKT